MDAKRAISHGVSIVIPCLNEETSIGQVVDAGLAGIKETGLPGEIVVVDNGSTDRSAAIARDHGARVVKESEKGYGAALRKGFAVAHYDILVMGDADLTYDFSRVNDLVRPIIDGEAEFVIGNRMKNIRPGSMPRLHQYFGNPLMSMLLRLLFRRHTVKDVYCGMRAIKNDTYKQLRCVTTGMEFASEMIVRAIHNNTRMAEREIIYHPRLGESKLHSFQDGWRGLRFMLLHSPTVALLTPGMVVWVIGTVMMLPLAFSSITIGTRSVDIHFMIIGGLLNTVSVQLISIGLLCKAYAHLTGVRDDPVIEWFYKHLTFEKILIATVPFILIGLAVILTIVVQWIESGFGELHAARALFFGMVCVINGTQIAAAGYLFSIMALPRHVGALSDEDEDDETPNKKEGV